jgi:hypothetical protein
LSRLTPAAGIRNPNPHGKRADLSRRLVVSKLCEGGREHRFSPRLAKGEIAALVGGGGMTRGISRSACHAAGVLADGHRPGGALVDEHGNVVGVVSAKLNASVALATSRALPENVNYAVKSSFLLSFLESVPDVASKLKEPNAKEEKFEDVVKSAQDAAVLVY